MQGTGALLEQIGFANFKSCGFFKIKTNTLPLCLYQ